MPSPPLASPPRLALLALLALAGCPGTLDDPGRFEAEACGDVPTTLLAPKCGTNAGCHTAESPASGLDLASPGVAERVIGVAATATCGGGTLADPADPQGSILFLKVTPDPPCGTRMPLGAADLTTAEEDCLLAWIAEQPAP